MTIRVCYVYYLCDCYFLYYSTPREESFTILLPERNPLLLYSQRGILYYSTPREESFTNYPTRSLPAQSRSPREDAE